MKYLLGFILIGLFLLSGCKPSQVGTSGSSGSGGGKGQEVTAQDIFARDLPAFRVSPEPNDDYEDFSSIEREDSRLKAKPSGPVMSSNDIAQPLEVKLSQIRSSRNSIEQMYGYRILIYSGPDATKANEYVELLEEMMEVDVYSGEALLPQLPVIYDYTEPNYVVKIGNYISRLEAHHQYVALDKEEFPQSIVISEPVPFRHGKVSNSNSKTVAPPTEDDK